MNNIFVCHICRMLIVCMGALPFSAYAAMVGTDQIAAAHRPEKRATHCAISSIAAKCAVGCRASASALPQHRRASMR